MTYSESAEREPLPKEPWVRDMVRDAARWVAGSEFLMFYGAITLAICTAIAVLFTAIAVGNAAFGGPDHDMCTDAIYPNHARRECPYPNQAIEKLDDDRFVCRCAKAEP